ncbi:MAG: hypothetical protein IJG36_12515 [Synergistaceae bacterium]|nr:hypothetical protein [Synergistaceae bacterium]
MPENINELYNRIDFLISGGAVKVLADFLAGEGVKAVIAEAGTPGLLNVIDAAGVVPSSLTLNDETAGLFTQTPAKEAYSLEYADGSKTWPGIIRIRGSHWEIYILLTEKPSNPESLMKSLEPYAGLVRLWESSRRISDAEKKLSRLSYMILATKNTLASIFEPMPLQYFASFLADVIQESLFPKSAAILKDEGSYLTVFNGKADSIPERKGIYAAQILPPAPVVVKNDSPVEVVLPVAEGECRLFCLMQWDNLPDEQTMNFLELLGSLAVRAIAINNLRVQSMRAEANISAGEFTVLSLSNVLKVLRGAGDKERFFSLLVDIFLEQSRMPNCVLASWNAPRKGYTLSEHRSGHIRADVDPTLLPSPEGRVQSAKISGSVYDLAEKTPDEIFKSWGLAGCPWKNLLKDGGARYIFPVCDDNSLAGIIVLGAGSEGRIALDRSQLASLQLIAQFAAYEFRRFE